MQEQKLERITPAQAGLDPQCIINMMDRMEKEHINITSFMLLRHGKVLCEASYEPYDATQLRTVYSVLVDVLDLQVKSKEDQTEGIGIDLGLKEFAVLSNGKIYKNINKTSRIKKLEKQLRRAQRCLSRKYENLKKMKKGESAQRANIQKQKLRVQKLHQKINQIRTDYINQTIAAIVKTKPSHITIEDLNVKGMMKNRHLSKAVASEKFYEFREKLMKKCHEEGIELRVVSRWYPSSRKCHSCGCIRKDLKLSDRIYRCSCGYVEDRDRNAALNLKDAETYEIA